MSKSIEDKFKRLLNSKGVTKCYVSSGFDFTARCPNGTILVDTKWRELNNEHL